MTGVNLRETLAAMSYLAAEERQNFGDESPLATQRAILRRAFDLGVTHFDLANNYGPR